MTETAGTYADEPSGKQTNITMSDRVRLDFQALADYQGIKFATLIRLRLEGDWANPGTQKLIERAKNEQRVSD